MKILKTEVIDGKQAELFMSDDGKIGATYDNKIITCGNKWRGFMDDKEAVEALLFVEVQSYLDKIEVEKSIVM